MANTNFNEVINNLLPLLLQAKQQRITNERRDKALQLQAQQQATAGRQRERQLDITESNAEKQLKQREKQYLNQTYDGLTWSEKKVWIESGLCFVPNLRCLHASLNSSVRSLPLQA